MGYEPRHGILAQVSSELLWPKLLRSVSLALRPERLFIAALTLVLMVLVLRIPGVEWWAGQAWSDRVDSLGDVGWAGLGWHLLDPRTWFEPLVLLVYNSAALWYTSWWTTLIVGPVALFILGLGGCMISRIAACDVAQGISLGWPEAWKFSTDRSGSILFALLAPLALVLLVWLALAAAGFALFSVAWINVLGGVLYVFFILAALLAVVVLAVYLIGFPLIIPAVACEGADGIDALARAYPYVFGRPLRYLLYVVILVILGHLALGVADLLASFVVYFAREAAMTWTGEPADQVISAIAAEGATSSERAAARMVKFWGELVRVVIVAFALSYFFCASTVLYLLMRRVCDGQDAGEIWMPGMIEGTMSMTMEARAKAGARLKNPGADPADDT